MYIVLMHLYSKETTLRKILVMAFANFHLFDDALYTCLSSHRLFVFFRLAMFFQWKAIISIPNFQM